MVVQRAQLQIFQLQMIPVMFSIQIMMVTMKMTVTTTMIVKMTTTMAMYKILIMVKKEVLILITQERL
jgi:hypothetical protein